MDPGAGMDVASMAQDGVFYGTVKKIIPAEPPNKPAHGFVACAETSEQFGRDVFLHSKLAERLQVGQKVLFGVSMNDKGMPQAVDVTLEDGADVMSGDVVQQAGKGCGKGGWSFPTGQRFFDLLMPEFAPAIQTGKGQSVAAALWEAAQLMGVDNDLRMQLMAKSAPQEKGYYEPKGWGKGGWDDPWDSKGCSYGKKGGGKHKNHSAPYGGSGGLDGGAGEGGSGKGRSGGGTPQSGGPYDGVVKSIKSSDPAHGFVTCEDTQQIYGRDVFLHSQQVSELEVGSRVQFEVMLNARGMPQAHNLVKFG